MSEQVQQPNAEETPPLFPAHLRRPADTKKELTDEEADRELAEAAEVIEKLAEESTHSEDAAEL